MTDNPKDQNGIVNTAFGATNRRRLLDVFFAKDDHPSADRAWADVYRLLLWVDQTTGLAHCYESDKCQPGRTWYSRSLAFHDWVSSSLNVKPAALAEEIDWLFRRAALDLAGEVVRGANRMLERAKKQREPYIGRGLPEPGTDLELVTIVKDVLGDHLSGSPSSDQWRLLVQRLRQYLMLENKRRNLLGEGFEDVLATVIRRCPGGSGLDLRTRQLLHTLPGFHFAGRNEKPNRVDLAILNEKMSRRILVTAKWSVRADREKQFTSEFADYVKAEADQKAFEYVFVTNEFDPARLMRACEKLSTNALMFNHVVHISTEALKATYRDSKEESMVKVLEHIKRGRLIDLQTWLGLLTQAQ